jgi:hypothetical protein
MADTVRKVRYCYLMVPNRAGQGAKVLAGLKEAGVSLSAYSGFPGRTGQAQIDLVTDDVAAVRRVAKRNGWRLSAVKKSFLVQGDDRLGAVARHLDRLAAAKVSVVAADAVAAGKGRYGMILWVRPKDYAKASRALKAR